MKKRLLLLTLLSAVSFGAMAWSGSGTENDPYQIATKEDLIQLITRDKIDQNVYFKQTADIDMYGTELKNRSLVFSGIFDGSEYAIKNFVSDNGLFMKIENATIKNVRLASGIIDYDGYTTGKVGAIVAEANASMISNCVNMATVISTSMDVGGICGKSQGGTISQCKNFGVIESSYDNVGGIVGSSHSDIISDCVNYGNITGKTKVGGLLGKSYSQIQRMKNFGMVYCNDTSEESYVGGIVGESPQLLIGVNENLDIYNYGEVYAPNAGYVGGIAGRLANGSRMGNVGNVTGANQVGGIAGYAGEIDMVYNLGFVEGVELVGGISADAGNLMNCFNRGTVQGGSKVGGLSNIVSSDEFKNCYVACKVNGIGDAPIWIGAVTGHWRTGGLISPGDFINCYYDDNVCALDPIGNNVDPGNGLSTGNAEEISAAFVDNATWMNSAENDGYPVFVGMEYINEPNPIYNVEISVEADETKGTISPYYENTSLRVGKAAILIFDLRAAEGYKPQVSVNGVVMDNATEQGMYVLEVNEDSDIKLGFVSKSSDIEDNQWQQGKVSYDRDVVIVENFEGFEARICDFGGRALLSAGITQMIQRIEIGSLPKGIYIVNLTNGAETVSEKILF